MMGLALLVPAALAVGLPLYVVVATRPYR